MPVPQLLEQAPYFPQWPTLQSTGQGWVLQVRSCSVAHSSPPWAAAVSTSKVRVWTPVPQVLVQVDQEFQLSTQSTGQGWVLQLRWVFKRGQAAPPFAWEVITERFLEVTPPPQSSVQSEAVDQVETLQSTGQAKLLQ
jgi:hypothetical protein